MPPPPPPPSPFERISIDPTVMGGRPCIKGTRVTVGLIIGLLAEGWPEDRVLADYPYLQRDDLRAALAYAAWRMGEQQAPLADAS